MPFHTLHRFNLSKFLLLSVAVSGFLFLQAQQSIEDTIPYVMLPDVQIKAFEQNKRMMRVPASINIIDRQTLNLYNSTSIVSAVNTMPGVRMEERSPGSYRFNIRGSSLRSPFGVRNVKVYYNDIPITDPGGQTYLNELGYYLSLIHISEPTRLLSI